MTTGRFFEDFHPGDVINHATPRTVTEGDAALYTALFGSRFLLTSSAEAARAVGHKAQPIDPFLVFHIVFGKTVPDVSLNAVANLGYADGRFGVPVYPGDTLSSTSEVLGVKETSSGKTGIVWVRTTGVNQRHETVLSYVRWVMVNKRDAASAAPADSAPSLPDAVDGAALSVSAGLHFDTYDRAAAGEGPSFRELSVGDHFDHVDGMTVEEAEHQMATRLYHNTARVHFNHFSESQGRFGKRLIYGGHVISLARALSFNGLCHAADILAINGGTHAAPLFAGDTVFAWSEVLDKYQPHGRNDCGAVRLRLVATKDQPCGGFPLRGEGGKYADGVILDFDYWALVPNL